MSKDLAFDENANIAWDLHESTELVPLEFTEENNVDLFGIEPTKAKEMVSGLSITLAEREVLKNAYVDVIDLEITTENIPTFKELRLKIMKNRTQGLTKWKEKEKAFYLAGGNFIQAIYNKEVAINEGMEAKLMEAEKFFENQEKEKARLLNSERIEKIKPYIEDVMGLDFSAMSDYDFDDYVLGKKTRFENDQKERKEREEAELLEKRKTETFQKRQVEIAPYMQFVTDVSQLKDMNERLYQDFLFGCKKAKHEFDEKVKLQEAENAKLKKEAEEKEKQRQAEIKAEQEKQAKIKAESDAKLKAEQEAKAKLEAELKAKKDAEMKAENERLAKEKADKLEADKLLKAGQKKQIETWIDTFQIEIPEHLKDDKIANDILSKFWSFRSWAKKETENL